MQSVCDDNLEFPPVSPVASEDISSPEEAVFYPSHRITVSHDVYTGPVHRTRLESCGNTVRE